MRIAGTKFDCWLDKGLKHWVLRYPDGYLKVLEKTWHMSVTRINQTLENHGLEQRVS